MNNSNTSKTIIGNRKKLATLKVTQKSYCGTTTENLLNAGTNTARLNENPKQNIVICTTCQRVNFEIQLYLLRFSVSSVSFSYFCWGVLSAMVMALILFCIPLLKSFVSLSPMFSWIMQSWQKHSRMVSTP